MEGGEAREFQDWEVLQHSEPTIDLAKNLTELDGFEGDSSEGIIRSDYFSLDSHQRYQRTASKGDVSEEGSVESDNPSWIDPASENLPFARKNSGDFWSDSSSDRSVDHKFSDPDSKNELGFVGNVKGHVGCGDKSVFMKEKDSELPDEENESITEDAIQGEPSVENETGNENVATHEVKSRGEEENRQMVWWKLPLELLKYCVFRASPVWSVSVAAVVMGFVILGRRLYKMKHKTRTLQLKFTVDDKKVSQFMLRAARLNEAFSVVRRVPIIRPSLPAAGVTPWPLMSLR